MHTKVTWMDDFIDSSDSEPTLVFSNTQIVKRKEDCEPGIILNSGSTITLAKNTNLLSDIKNCDITMCSNGWSRQIKEEGHWPGIGQTYLENEALTNIVSISEAVKRGYHVKFDSHVEN